MVMAPMWRGPRQGVMSRCVPRRRRITGNGASRRDDGRATTWGHSSSDLGNDCRDTSSGHGVWPGCAPSSSMCRCGKALHGAEHSNTAGSAAEGGHKEVARMAQWPGDGAPSSLKKRAGERGLEEMSKDDLMRPYMAMNSPAGSRRPKRRGWGVQGWWLDGSLRCLLESKGTSPCVSDPGRDTGHQEGF
jgi:hypothetical protein